MPQDPQSTKKPLLECEHDEIILHLNEGIYVNPFVLLHSDATLYVYLRVKILERSLRIYYAAGDPYAGMEIVSLVPAGPEKKHIKFEFGGDQESLTIPPTFGFHIRLR